MRALGMMTLGMALLSSGCSFTTAGGLSECTTSGDCGSNSVCTSGFCLPQPAGCDQVVGATSAANPIVLGALLPLTNASGNAEIEQQRFNGLKLALNEVNSLEGVGGRQFVMYVCDTKADVENAKTQATWLVNDKQVVAVFSAGSAQTTGVSTITIKKNVLLMSHTATSATFTNLDDKNGGPVGLVWRTTPSDALQGRVISEVLSGKTAINDPGNTFTVPAKIGVAYVNDNYGQGLFSQLLDRLPSKVGGAQYERNGDVGTAVSWLKTNKPDLTVLAGFTEDNARLVPAAVAEQVKVANGNRWFLTDASKDPTLLSNDATAAELAGTYGTAPASARPDDSVYQLFNSRFRTAYNNTDPAQFSFTAHAYDAMYLVTLGAAYAIGNDLNNPGAVTGDRIAMGLTKLTPPSGQTAKTYSLGPVQFSGARDELRAGNIVNVRGASGELDFNNDTGEAISPYELFKVSGKNFTQLQVITPAAD
ncbi:ABC transporter substrate-binding protein [Corallococcus exiguus]|uniref:ABC transporter substrate-binding protein n=1 Tax=Corallococcus exiguus TaxID=83462 RepID=UPI001471D083|nr:ABC transporter substrate-binding protein [Corallococcus exiguus]NNB89244.1 ABC transporter substrate-binding protein [Corallococcus exiguus]NNB99318.1 ABC transporter substrate-binding protein [Corallococcus exiguus]NNC05671.1 ABC transporter substrate-binding protein [Corallococcus exiguus]